jgi:hypothetical protein
MLKHDDLQGCCNRAKIQNIYKKKNNNKNK